MTPASCPFNPIHMLWHMHAPPTHTHTQNRGGSSCDHASDHEAFSSVSYNQSLKEAVFQRLGAVQFSLSVTVSEGVVLGVLRETMASPAERAILFI